MSTEPGGAPLSRQFWVVLALTAFWLLQMVWPGAEQPSPTLYWIRLGLTAVGIVYLVGTLMLRRQ